MSEYQIHRQLLNAAKALLHRLEERGSNPFARMTQKDWVVVVQANRAIAESKDALEIAGNSRREVCRI